MGLVSGLWMAVLGILGAANLVIAKKPDAKQLIDKLAPYQGWIGAISALWGLWGIISAVLTLGWFAFGVPGILLWATYTVTAVVQFALGLLLGVGVLKTFIKQPQAVEKMDQMIVKLAPKQGVLGLIAIGIGVWCTISGFIFSIG